MRILSRDEIREIFLAHGFTVKEGQTDLKPYVYEAAEALLSAAFPVKELGHGCHADLFDDEKPDTCVFDEGYVGDCSCAMRLKAQGKGRDDCEYWRPIKVLA